LSKIINCPFAFVRLEIKPTKKELRRGKLFCSEITFVSISFACTGLNSLAGKREKRKLLYRSTTEFEKYDIIAGSLEVRRLPFSQDCIFPVQNAVYKFIKY